MFTCSMNKIRGLYFTNIVLVVMLPIIVDLSVSFLAIGAAFVAFTLCGRVVTFHRYYAHSSFEFQSRAIEILFTVLGTLGGTGSALGWASIHRAHHKNSDRPGDPHDPCQLGVPRILAMGYPHMGWSNVKDLTKNKLIMHTHHYYFAYLAAYATALLGVGGIDAAYNFFIFPSMLVVFTSTITALVHHYPAFGYQSHGKQKSTNIWWCNFLDFGDSWHNNHHQNPSARTTKERWWEFDPAGQVIKLVRA